MCFFLPPYRLRAWRSHPTRFFFDFFAHTFNAFASDPDPPGGGAFVNDFGGLLVFTSTGNAIAGDTISRGVNGCTIGLEYPGVVNV